MSDDNPAPLKRRDALKLLAASAAAAPLTSAFERKARVLPVVDTNPPTLEVDETAAPLAGPRGTPTDPDLVRPRVTWTNKLSTAELVTLSALCDVIVPADAKSPSAAAVGVPAYINEYVSAPYDGHKRDLVRVRGGLAWLNAESRRRYSRAFARLTMAQKTAICDDICYVPTAKPEFRAAARFFARVRDLTAEGFYTTDAGMKDIGYVGNIALPKWELPPKAVLKHLGLE